MDHAANCPYMLQAFVRGSSQKRFPTLRFAEATRAGRGRVGGRLTNFTLEPERGKPQTSQATNFPVETRGPLNFPVLLWRTLHPLTFRPLNCNGEHPRKRLDMKPDVEWRPPKSMFFTSTIIRYIRIPIVLWRSRHCSWPTGEMCFCCCCARAT